MIKIIDPHVHCRDEEQGYKTTISERLKLAERVGVVAIFDMPNTANPVTTRKRVFERLSLAEKADSPVFYGTYIGLTSSSEQVREAVKIYSELFPKVVGLKLFAGRSVGNLEIIEEEDQKKVYEALRGYRGVLEVHCEKESLMRPELWDYKNPISHCRTRPSIAELKSIEDQFKFAYDANFKGTLHIAHISTPESVELVDDIRKTGVLKVSCGATPHHLFMYDKMMNEERGIMYKVNPPLRTKKEQEGLLENLKQGKIDWIETDDATHTFEEKTGIAKDKNGRPIYMSGIQGIYKWQEVIQQLSKRGFPEEQINDLVFNNVLKTFRLNNNFYKHG